VPAGRGAQPFSSSPDPFAGPGAQASDFDVRASRLAVRETCDLVGKKPRKKPADLNPLERRWFEEHGWTFERCEHKGAFDGRKHDLWTFGDWLAVRGDETLIVQTCRKHDMNNRENKARAVPELAAWLSGGGRRFVIHGWHQPGGKGRRWELVEREVLL